MDNNSPVSQALQSFRTQPITTNPDPALTNAIAQSQQQNQQIQQQQAAYAQASPQFSPAAISQATAALKPKAKDPVTKVGNALSTKDYSGLCLAYVDDQTGNNNRQPTAYADYEANAASGNIKTTGTPPKGARIYFAPTPDNPAGHIMLSNGDGTGTGATTNQGIKTFNIKDWEKYAGQQYIGYAPPGAS